MSRLRIRGACATAGVAALLVTGAGVGAAGAGGNGAVTFTDNQHAVVDVFTTVNPCTGDPGTIDALENQVFHGTVNKTGSWFTGTVEGRFTFTPDDASKATYTGHFATWFGDENNLRNGVEHSTFDVNATGSDGSHLQFHDNAQATLNANGTVTVSFDHMSCA
ncbi:hypothetical protein GCM10009868_09210 [Terrabacter aerolatus]|uniref:Uncharacterized protein n=1 Tax=Terrabacter aerolatus TaxID=422442 RepID=A0A512D4K7_9MICO|nr:hypothetical protein [Terrabacter aerolatus]GEO31404.1 hypothetical protein TAE01_32140 [Terrabacter aerolatus]